MQRNSSPTLTRCHRKARKGRRRTPSSRVVSSLFPILVLLHNVHRAQNTVGAQEGRGARGADKGGGGGRAILSPGLDSEPFIGARGARGPRPGLTLGRFLVHLPVHLPPRRTRTARVRKREKARDGAASYFSIKTKIAENRCFDPPSSFLCLP